MNSILKFFVLSLSIQVVGLSAALIGDRRIARRLIARRLIGGQPLVVSANEFVLGNGPLVLFRLLDDERRPLPSAGRDYKGGVRREERWGKARGSVYGRRQGWVAKRSVNERVARRSQRVNRLQRRP